MADQDGSQSSSLQKRFLTSSETKSGSWEAAQVKAFSRWCNCVLEDLGLHIDDLFEDLKSGVILCHLVEELSGMAIGSKINPNPVMKVQKLEMLEQALLFLQNTEEVTLVNVGALDIYGGNHKIILGLVWTLIQEYHIRGNGAGAKLDLLDFVNAQIAQYDLSINNFDSDWKDGRVISALTCSLGGQAIDMSALPADPEQCCSEAIACADKELLIPLIVDPADMALQPDAMAIMTLMSYYRERHKNPITVGRTVQKLSTHGNRSASQSRNASQCGTPTASRTPSRSFAFSDMDHSGLGSPGKLFVPGGLGTVDDKGESRSGSTGPHSRTVSIFTGALPTVVRASAEGDAAWDAATGWPCKFSVHLMDEDGKPVRGDAAGGAPLEVRLQFLDEEDTQEGGEGEGGSSTGQVVSGSARPTATGFDVEYSVERSGRYQLMLERDGQQLPGLPPRTIIARKHFPEIAHCTVAGIDGDTPMLTGEVANLVLKAANSDGPLKEGGCNQFMMSVIGPRGTPQPSVPLTDRGDGSYSADFSSSVAGSHSVAITLRGQHIDGSPFQVEVEGCSASALEAQGDALHHANVGDLASVMVVANGSDPDASLDYALDELVATLTPPGGGPPQEVPLMMTEDGEGLEMQYVPEVAGPHVLSLMLDGEYISGAPFTIHVAEEGAVRPPTPSQVQPAEEEPPQQQEAPPQSPPRQPEQPEQPPQPEQPVQPVQPKPEPVQPPAPQRAPPQQEQQQPPAQHLRTPSSPIAATARVEGLSQGKAGKISAFRVVTTNGANGSSAAKGLRVTVLNGQTLTSVPTHLSGREGGNGSVVDVQFTPRQAGLHSVTVTLHGKSIAGSPFPIEVTAAPVSATHSRMEGLSAAPRPGQPLGALRLVCCDAHGHPMGRDAKGQRVNVELWDERSLVKAGAVTDLGDGTYGVKLTAPQRSGRYVLHARVNGKALSGFPRAMMIQEDLARVHGLDKPTRLSGRTTFTVVGGYGPFSATLQPEAGGAGVQQCTPAAQRSDSAWPLSFQPTHVGRHVVRVMDASGKQLPDSPISVLVQNAVPRMCQAQGPGLRAAQCSEANTFTIHARDEQGNPISSAVAAVSPEPFAVTVTDGQGRQLRVSKSAEQQGGCRITYAPEHAGEHTVSVTLHGQHIGDSPYRVMAQKALRCYVQGPALEGVEQGTDSSFDLLLLGVKDQQEEQQEQVPRPHVQVQLREVLAQQEGEAEAATADSEWRDGSVTDHGDGTYKLSYPTDRAGSHELRVLLDGRVAKGFPRTLNVRPAAVVEEKAIVSPALSQRSTLSVATPKGINHRRTKSAPAPAHDGACAQLCFLEGDAIELGATAGEPAYVDIIAMDANGRQVQQGGEVFDLMVTDRRGRVVDAEVEDCDDGTYEVCIRAPAGAEGPLSVACSLYGTPIRDSPYTVDLLGGAMPRSLPRPRVIATPAPAPEPEPEPEPLPVAGVCDVFQSYAKGPGVQSGEVGVPVSFTIFAVDANGKGVPEGGEDFQVTVRGPSMPSLAQRKEMESRITEGAKAKLKRLAPWFGFEIVDANVGRGVVIRQVAEDGPSAQAGVQPFDEIVSVNGIAPRSRAHFPKVIRGKTPGQTVEVVVRTPGGEPRTCHFTLGSRKATPKDVALLTRLAAGDMRADDWKRDAKTMEVSPEYGGRSVQAEPDGGAGAASVRTMPPARVTDRGNGMYTVSFTPEQMGRHSIDVSLHGQPLTGRKGIYSFLSEAPDVVVPLPVAKEKPVVERKKPVVAAAAAEEPQARGKPKPNVYNKSERALLRALGLSGNEETVRTSVKMRQASREHRRSQSSRIGSPGRGSHW